MSVERIQSSYWHSFVVLYLSDGQTWITEKTNYGIILQPLEEIRQFDKVDKLAQQYVTNARVGLADIARYFNSKEHVEYGLLRNNCHVYSSALWMGIFGSTGEEILRPKFDRSWTD